MNQPDENQELPDEQEIEEFIEELESMKNLILTRNEALYLSDSVTLLLEHFAENGRYQSPARTLVPSAGVPVPIEIIQRLGLAVLLTTDPYNTEQTCEMDFSVSELFLLRECCQSFIRVNKEPVGYNLIRKIYRLILEKDLKEREVFEILTHDVNMNFSMTEPVIERTEDGNSATT